MEVEGALGEPVDGLERSTPRWPRSRSPAGRAAGPRAGWCRCRRTGRAPPRPARSTGGCTGGPARPGTAPDAHPAPGRRGRAFHTVEHRRRPATHRVTPALEPGGAGAFPPVPARHRDGLVVAPQVRRRRRRPRPPRRPRTPRRAPRHLIDQAEPGRLEGGGPAVGEHHPRLARPTPGRPRDRHGGVRPTPGHPAPAPGASPSAASAASAPVVRPVQPVVEQPS